MSASPDFMSQLLQGGLMGQPQGGIMGGLMSDPNALLGLNLLAQSNEPGRFGALLGKGVLNTQQGMLNTQSQKLDIAGRYLQLQQAMAQQQALQEYANSIGQRQPQAAPAPQQSGPQSPMSAPPSPQLGSPSGSVQTQQQPSLFDAASDISNTPVNGMSPDMYRRLGVLARKDPLTIEKELRTAQLASAQDRIKPQLDAIDTLIESDKPSQYVKADPQALALWQRAAPRLGMNPVNDFTDQNIRTALTYARNEAASRVNLPISKAPVKLDTINGPLGSIMQKDPLTGKLSQVKGEEETAQFVQPDGSVKLMTKAQGMNQGLTPFNPATFINPQAADSIAKQIAEYKMPPLSGFALKTAQGQETMRQVMALNPQYDASQYGTKVKARAAFATGKQGDVVRSLSVATDHLDQLSRAVDELKNGGIPAANKVANFFSQQTGNPSVTNFDAMKEIVGDEVVKAVVGATGSAGDREAIKKTFSAANSPQQLYGVIAKYKGLMGGQLKGLRQQYERTTGLNDFDTAISESANTELNPSSAQTTSLNVGQSQSIGGFTVRRVK